MRNLAICDKLAKLQILTEKIRTKCKTTHHYIPTIYILAHYNRGLHWTQHDTTTPCRQGLHPAPVLLQSTGTPGHYRKPLSRSIQKKNQNLTFFWPLSVEFILGNKIVL